MKMDPNEVKNNRLLARENFLRWQQYMVYGERLKCHEWNQTIDNLKLSFF
jgi:hypothetical protein